MGKINITIKEILILLKKLEGKQNQYLVEFYTTGEGSVKDDYTGNPVFVFNFSSIGELKIKLKA